MAATTLDLDAVPAMKAPPGQHSNLVDPPSQTWPLILCMTLMIALPVPFVAIRVYTRHRVHHKLWWDDTTCVLGWVFLVAYGGMLMKSIDYGGCRDLWNVSKADYMQFTKLFHKIEIIARVGMTFTKTAIVLFFHRLFVVDKSRRPPVWWVIWFVFWWNLLYAIALVLSVAFQCVGKDALVREGHECMNEYAVLVCASVINVTTDLMILTIPIFGLWGLQMPFGKKIRLFAVFAVGVLGALASIARLAYQLVYAEQPNKTVIFVIVLLINAAEQSLGEVVACMPLLPAFHRHLWSKAKGSSPSSYQSNRLRGLSASILAKRSGGSSGKPKDPYPIYSTRGYEEIDVERRGEDHRDNEGIVKGTELTVISEVRSKSGQSSPNVF